MQSQFLTFFRGSYKSRYFLVPVVVFSIAYTVPKFFELRLAWRPSGCDLGDQMNVTQCSCDQANVTCGPELIATDLRKSKPYIIVYLNWINVIIQVCEKSSHVKRDLI